MKKITIESSGSLGPNKTIIRDEISWIKSANAESKLFNFDKNEIYAAACGSSHSLHKYAKFRSHLTNSLFVDDKSNEKTNNGYFSTKYFAKNIQKISPSIIYTLPNILRVACIFLKKKYPKKKFEKVKMILCGGEAWIPGLEILVKDLFPKAKLIEFYGAAELGFVGWGDPGKGFNLFPGVQAWCDESSKIWVDSPYIANIASPATVGDIGWFDEKGLLHLAGRSDRDFRINGVTICPEKIENLLRKNSKIINAYVFKKNHKNRSGRIAVVVYGELKNNITPNQITELKLTSLCPSLKNVIKKILEEEKMNLSISQFKKTEIWPLSNSGKTNFKLLENLW